MSAPLFQEEQSILDWLECVTTTFDKPQTKQRLINLDNSGADIQRPEIRARKRKHQPDNRLLSPPISLRNHKSISNDMENNQTPKRLKRSTNDAADDTTPRQQAGEVVDDWTPRQQIPPLSSSDARSLSSASQSQSQKSNMSPPKLFPQLSINPAGSLKRTVIDVRNPDIPRDLAGLIVEMQAIGGRGDGIVPVDLKPAIDQRKQEDLINSHFYSEFYDSGYGPNDGSLNASPSLDTIIEMVNFAIECDETTQDETGWNHLVHSPLLDLVLGRLPRNLVGFAPCMNANITTQFRLPSAPGARVDYAIFVNPVKDDDPRLPAAVENIQLTIPGSIVNHTSFVPLNSRPISISIETKRQNGAGGKAEIQIGIWQAAQWNLLSQLAGAAIEKLPFIPGILVEGHVWKMVATTRKGSKTIFWTSQDFGHTGTCNQSRYIEKCVLIDYATFAAFHVHNPFQAYFLLPITL